MIPIAERKRAAHDRLLDAAVKIVAAIFEQRARRGVERVPAIPILGHWQGSRGVSFSQAKIGWRDPTAAAHQQRVMDDVLELANVAGPAVPLQALRSLRIQVDLAQSQPLPVDVEEVFGQRLDVAGPIAQRRQRQDRDLEPVVQVLAEAPGADGIRQIDVRGSDQPHVDRDRCPAAHADHLVLLQHAQQLDLHRDRKIADLVEEQRSSVGGLEPTGLRAERPGERALLVAEQLTLYQRRRQCGAIDGHEGAAPASAQAMQVARNDLLAGTGLADDQGRRVAGGDALQALEESARQRILEHQGLRANAEGHPRGIGQGQNRHAASHLLYETYIYNKILAARSLAVA